MKEFMFLFVGGNRMEGLSAEQQQEHMQKWGQWIGSLKNQGVYKSGAPLQPNQKRIIGEDKVLKDGPFAEAKELVGGYVSIEAKTEQEAIAEAKNCPIYEDGGLVEVREILQMDM